MTTLDRLIGEAPDARTRTLKALATRPHNCTLLELMALGAITAIFRPSRVLEIGIYDGRSAIPMAANLPEGAQVYTLNLPPDYLPGRQNLGPDEILSGKIPSGYRWQGMPEEDRITQLWGNSLEFDFSPLAPVQMAFIDGGHTMEIVLSDFGQVEKIVDRQHSIVQFHDAPRYGVRPALERLQRQGHKPAQIAGILLAVIRYLDGQQTKPL